MKKLNNYISLFLLMGAMLTFGTAFSGCSDESNLSGSISDNSKVQLSLWVDSVSISRSPDTEIESQINHLDVFVFPVQADGDIEQTAVPAFYEHFVSPSGNLSLGAYDDYSSNQSYRVYAVANYLGEVSFSKETTWAALSQLKDGNTADRNFYTDPIRPFLMDGKSFPEVLNNPSNPKKEPVSLTLKRAAAKIQLNLQLGENLPKLKGGVPQTKLMFYAREAFVMDGSYSGFNEGQIELNSMTNYRNLTAPVGEGKRWDGTFYSYENSWQNAQHTDEETYMLLHLAFEDADDPNKTIDSYYALYFHKVDGKENEKIERNVCYKVTANINALGSSTTEEPLPVEGTFTKAPWIEENIEVGGDGSQVHFLVVNSNEVEFSDMTEYGDITFSSSSPLKNVAIVDGPSTDNPQGYAPYYYDKYNRRQLISKNYQNYLPKVSDYDKNVLNGNIAITSEWPEDNGKSALAFAVKYFQVKVMNQEGDIQYINVAHNPLVYATSHAGWYSTFLENGESHYWDYLWGANNGYEWKIDSSTKEYEQPGLIVDGQNPYDTDEYGNLTKYSVKELKTYIPNASKSAWNMKEITIGTTANPRSYHIHVTKSSANYVVGVPPRDENGYTSPRQDVEQMISPSFLVSSALLQVSSLAAIFTDGYTREQANKYCKNYVEVTDFQYGLSYDNRDPELMKKVNRYAGWRLPTLQEFLLIAKIQGGYKSNYKGDDNENSVVDILFSDNKLWMTASQVVNFSGDGDIIPEVVNKNNGQFRCVRDVIHGENTNPIPWQ